MISRIVPAIRDAGGELSTGALLRATLLAGDDVREFVSALHRAQFVDHLICYDKVSCTFKLEQEREVA